MKVLTTELEGVCVVERDVYGDDRGFFMETPVLSPKDAAAPYLCDLPEEKLFTYRPQSA